MRSVDLALYADGLAAEAAALAARLERARGALRRAAIEHEARLALRPEIVSRLERLGVLATQPTEGLGSEMAEIQAELRALEALQAWVEAQLASGRPAASEGDPAGLPDAAGDRAVADPAADGTDALVKEPAMSA